MASFVVSRAHVYYKLAHDQYNGNIDEKLGDIAQIRAYRRDSVIERIQNLACANLLDLSNYTYTAPIARQIAKWLAPADEPVHPFANRELVGLGVQIQRRDEASASFFPPLDIKAFNAIKIRYQDNVACLNFNDFFYEEWVRQRAYSYTELRAGATVADSIDRFLDIVKIAERSILIASMNSLYGLCACIYGVMHVDRLHTEGYSFADAGRDLITTARVLTIVANQNLSASYDAAGAAAGRARVNIQGLVGAAGAAASRAHVDMKSSVRNSGLVRGVSNVDFWVKRFLFDSLQRDQEQNLTLPISNCVNLFTAGISTYFIQAMLGSFNDHWSSNILSMIFLIGLVSPIVEGKYIIDDICGVSEAVRDVGIEKAIASPVIVWGVLGVVVALLCTPNDRPSWFVKMLENHNETMCPYDGNQCVNSPGNICDEMWGLDGILVKPWL